MTQPTQAAKPAVSILDKISARISPLGLKRKVGKFMLYGPSGGGKTVLAGQAPNPLIVDVEKGTFSMSNHPDLIDSSKVKVLEYVSFYQLEELVKLLNQGEFPEVETLVIDSMSELHKRGLAEVTQREYRGGSGRNKDGARRNQFVPETEDHTENNEHIRRLTSALRDLNRNIIVTAHHRTVPNKDGSQGPIFPDFSEKLANTLMGIFDVVGYVNVRKVDGQDVRSMRVRTDGKVACKTRLGALPDELIDPTWTDLWKAVEAQPEGQPSATSIAESKSESAPVGDTVAPVTNDPTPESEEVSPTGV